MILPVKIQVKQLDKEMLFEAFKREEVLTYCQRCSNYGKNHSCPDFAFDPVDYLEPYQYASVILTEIDTEPIRLSMDQLDPGGFGSRVLDNYQQEKLEAMDISSMVSMYAFEEIKNQMSEKLIAFEKQVGHAVGLPPGSCTRCAVCTKKYGNPCRFPEKLRYSLEALGFLVSEIYQRYFDRELGWANGELPEQFCTCSVLMTRERMDEGLLMEKLKGMMLPLSAKETCI